MSRHTTAPPHKTLTHHNHPLTYLQKTNSTFHKSASDPLHCEINLATWILLMLFQYARLLGDAHGNLPISSAEHPAQLFIETLLSIQDFKSFGRRFANRLIPNPPKHAETEIRASGRHAVILYKILAPIRAALGGLARAPEFDSLKLLRITIEIVALAERHLFVFLRASTVKVANIEHIQRFGRMVHRLLVGAGIKVTYNLWVSSWSTATAREAALCCPDPTGPDPTHLTHRTQPDLRCTANLHSHQITFVLLPHLLTYIQKTYPHSDPELIYGLAFLATTQAHERLNQWVKAKARYTDRREGWTGMKLKYIAALAI